MGMYCWETHTHTAEISPCGVVSTADTVETYIREGYTGIVITNHFSRYGLSYVQGRPWKEQVDWFCDGFEAAREAAGDRLRVLFGAEVNLNGDPNDYLVYGMTREFLREHPELTEMSIEKLSALVRTNGWLLIQAHPFRNGMRIVPPDRLDGVEAFNGNLRHDSRNFLAAQWAARYGLLTISGSDFHETEDTARGGIFTGRDIRTEADLIAAVREGVVLKTSAEKFGL